jgi:hypothetical protein
MCDQALMKSRIGEAMSFVGDSSASRPEGEDLEHGSAGTSEWKISS